MSDSFDDLTFLRSSLFDNIQQQLAFVDFIDEDFISFISQKVLNNSNNNLF